MIAPAQAPSAPTPHLLSPLADGLWRFEKVLPTGWGLNMFVVRLADGRLLLHSPTAVGAKRSDVADADQQALFAALDALGRTAVLFAPNHFHHLGLRRYRDRYPDAIAVAGDLARPRLLKQGHPEIAPLAQAEPLLPKGARFLVPDGTRAGEVFLSLPGAAGPTWITSDAFFNVNRPVTGAMGFVLRLLKTLPGPCIGQTFLWLALANRRRYRAWLLGELEREPPRRILVSHGDPIDVDLPALRALVERRL